MKITIVYLTGLIWACTFVPSLTVDMTPTIQVPSPIRDGDNGEIEVRCRYEGQARGIALEFIKLQSKKPSGNTRLLADVVGSTATIRDQSLMSRATVAGSISESSTTSSYLTLSIRNVSCVEASTYTCLSQYQNGSVTMPLSAEKVVEGISNPTELERIVEPVKSKYPTGERVKITCTGKVGKPAQDWSWYKYDETEKLWQPIKEGIVNSQVNIVSDCAFSSHSNLTLTIPDENEHKFRCTAGHNVEYSVFTTLNGDVSGADTLLGTFVPLVLSLMFTMVLGRS